ncbi:unnamed protein product [Calicophoron daubneyi]|uniref:Uncharacterized protein n=1 Tax=Calicophoron daubneyi TaxID=300641 RepID=A0AAV2T4F9_CALDB
MTILDLFCFGRKKSPDDRPQGVAEHLQLYSACIRNPQPASVVQMIETEEDLGTASKPGTWPNEYRGDVENEKEKRTKHVLSRAEMRKLRAQSNLQLYKFSLPLVADK